MMIDRILPPIFKSASTSALILQNGSAYAQHASMRAHYHGGASKWALHRDWLQEIRVKAAGLEAKNQTVH